MLWTEKYRPKNIHELIGQEIFKLDAENWIEIKDMPNLLLYGQAGVGKTAAAGILGQEILQSEMGSNYFEINASDDRRLEVVRTTIKDIAQQKAIGNVPFKIILLDEMDGMTPDAQNALKRIMERYSNNVRWNCVSCGKIIETGSYVGQYYCSIRGCFTLRNVRARENRERMKTKHRIKSFVKNIEWESNTEKYKVKNDSFKAGRPKGSRDLKQRKTRTDY